jgi:epoxyqueuosine reductase
MKKSLILFILICWTAAVLALLWYPMLNIPRSVSGITYYDKIAHLVFFGVMTFLIIAFLKDWNGWKFRRIAFISVVIAFVIAVLGEYVQSYIPGRTPSYLDLFAGLIGSLLAVPLAYMLYHSPRPKLLLHVCCAPCASAVTEILATGYRLELFFFNPNIDPISEYEKRLEEVKRLADQFGVKLRIGDYNHQDWLAAIAGHEGQPEGGSRCELCFQYRLRRAAELASQRNIPVFATTLTISPHKNSYQVNRAGLAIAAILGQNFLSEDFKENNGWQRSLVLSKKLGFYRQKYCGCEFSRPAIKTPAQADSTLI